MLPRECDNDACDYEPGDGGRGVWRHAAECAGPVPFGELVVSDPHPESFLTFIKGWE